MADSTFDNRSPAERLASCSPEIRESFIKSLSAQEQEAMLWNWSKFHARPNQVAPEGDWSIWLILGGRGFGKTRAGAEWVRSQVMSGKARRIALVAETAADGRDVMVEGDSGILSVHPPSDRPVYEPSKRRLTWPNGAVATVFNATEPDQLRGPQFDLAWCDEIAKWRYAQETWDMLQMGLRIGTNPRSVVTTTPRSIPIVRNLVEGKEGKVAVTHGRTYDNRSNLAPKFLQNITRRYANTRLGRQELDAEILSDVDGALWTGEIISAALISPKEIPDLTRVVVAVDPSGAANSSSEGDTIGIVVAGVDEDKNGYILEDVSVIASPNEWGRIAVEAYDRHDADLMIAESNYGGAMVESVVRSIRSTVNYKAVHASRGKVVRAEPVAALYEQGRIKHVGSFPKLEDQLGFFTPGAWVGEGSPDRADAMIWAITELILGAETKIETGSVRGLN